MKLSTPPVPNATLTWSEIRNMLPGTMVSLQQPQAMLLTNRMDWRRPVATLHHGDIMLVLDSLWEKMDGGAWLHVIGPDGSAGHLNVSSRILSLVPGPISGDTCVAS